ncbi:MAG: YceI family protein [Gemmatimonadales bacterium]
MVPRFPLLLTLLLIGSVASVRAAQVPAPIGSGTLLRGKLSFDGHATLGDFTGVTTTVRGEVTAAAELAGVRGWVEAPVNSLKTGNGTRDHDLNSSMESGTFPVIRFDLTEVAPGTTRGDTVALTLRGTLKIHGIERAVDLPGTAVFSAGQVEVRTDFPLNLHDYQIKGLSKFFGTLKMHPDIVVHVDVIFSPGG